MDKLFAFLRNLITERFYGTVTIKFESGKVTHVDVETRRSWQYKDLPVEPQTGSCVGGKMKSPVAPQRAAGGEHNAA